MDALEDTIEAGPPAALQRQCGRCRAFFPADPALDARAIADWWACDPCRLVLFPGKTLPATKREN